MAQVQHAPAVGKELLDGCTIKESLGLTVDEVVVRFDFRMTVSAEVVIFRGVEPTEQQPRRAKGVADATNERDGLGPREVVQAEAGEHHVGGLNWKRRSNVLAVELAVRHTGSSLLDCRG